MNIRGNKFDNAVSRRFVSRRFIVDRRCVESGESVGRYLKEIHRSASGLVQSG